MEKTFSVDDLVGNLWRLGRTPSEANLQQIEQTGDECSPPEDRQQPTANSQPHAHVNSQPHTSASMSAPQAHNPQHASQPNSSLPRVPSLEVFRRLFGSAPSNAPDAAGVSQAAEHAGTPPPPPAPALAPAPASTSAATAPTGTPVQKPEPLRTADVHTGNATGAHEGAQQGEIGHTQHGAISHAASVRAADNAAAANELAPQPEQHDADNDSRGGIADGPVSSAGTRSNKRKRAAAAAANHALLGGEESNAALERDSPSNKPSYNQRDPSPAYTHEQQQQQQQQSSPSPSPAPLQFNAPNSNEEAHVAQQQHECRVQHQQTYFGHEQQNESSRSQENERYNPRYDIRGREDINDADLSAADQDLEPEQDGNEKLKRSYQWASKSRRASQSTGSSVGKQNGKGTNRAAKNSNNGGRMNPSLTARVQTVDENGNELSAEEIRRQRRMLSNRESARRSRKRKMEHVHVLESQVSQLKADKAQLINRVHELEHRYEVTLRETAAMRAEVDRLHSLLASQGAERQGGAAPTPVQPIPARTPSWQNLHHAAAAAAAAGSNGGGASHQQQRQEHGENVPVASHSGIPDIHAQNKREIYHLQHQNPNAPNDGLERQSLPQTSQQGFVPFRSVSSYENLLSLHQQERKQYENVGQENDQNINGGELRGAFSACDSDNDSTGQ